MSSLFHIVLFEPEIPQNTGTIGRLCVSCNAKLHLIKPLGFSLDEQHLKRAGMDYWQYLDLTVYENWDEFLRKNEGLPLYFISTHGRVTYWDTAYPEECGLVFGRESSGLPPDFYERYRDLLRLIPMPGKFHRSLNLANSVSIVLHEAMRQHRE